MPPVLPGATRGGAWRSYGPADEAHGPRMPLSGAMPPPLPPHQASKIGYPYVMSTKRCVLTSPPRVAG